MDALSYIPLIGAGVVAVAVVGLAIVSASVSGRVRAFKHRPITRRPHIVRYEIRTHRSDRLPTQT